LLHREQLNSWGRVTAAMHSASEAAQKLRAPSLRLSSAARVGRTENPISPVDRERLYRVRPLDVRQRMREERGIDSSVSAKNAERMGAHSHCLRTGSTSGVILNLVRARTGLRGHGLLPSLRRARCRQKAGEGSMTPEACAASGNGWVELWNGRDLDGWRVSGPRESWSV